MKKYDKEIMQAALDNEKDVLGKLTANYEDALEEINSKIAALMGRADADMSHVIYQVEYQKALKKQIEGILLQLQMNEFESISEYLTKSYEEGFLGTLYAMQSQGVPLIFPLNQEEIVAAIQHETKLTSSLYAALDIKDLQKKIAAEISRGFATGALYKDMARNVAAVTGIGKNKAMTIARTEGHRITEKAAHNAQTKAKDRGADVVRVWDATLDSKTRPSHSRVDGEIREVDEKFSNGLMYPGDPSGAAAEVINCRCRSRTEARWALDAPETKMLGDTSKMSEAQKKAIADKLGIPVEDLDLYSGQIVPINAKSYAEFKQEYNKLWHYEGSALQQEVEPRIAKLEGKAADSIETVSSNSTKALQRAYEERRIKNNLQEVPISELKNSNLNPIKADYSGISVDTAKVFDETLSGLMQEYESGLTSIRVGDKKEMLGVANFATTRHANSVAQKELVLNPYKVGDYDKYVDRMKELQKNGYAVKLTNGMDAKYIPTHEFAHSLIDMESPLKNFVGLDTKPLTKFRQEIKAVYREYKDAVSGVEAKISTIKKLPAFFDFDIGPEEQLDAFRQLAAAQKELNELRISRYSLENADEFLAEAFTQAKIGESVGIYSDKVIEIVDKYFKK